MVGLCEVEHRKTVTLENLTSILHPLVCVDVVGRIAILYMTIDRLRDITEPVKLVQEFRKFDYLSPWEGTDYVLPGDEKAKS